MKLLKAQRGVIAKVARGIGLTRSAVHQWQQVPAERVPEVERITGLSRHQLRPDLWDAPQPAEAA